MQAQDGVAVEPPVDAERRQATADIRTPAANLAEIVAQCTDELATRLSVAKDDVEVVEARFVIWPDSSAGCPQPGVQYMQVRTEGVLVRLRADQRIYHYTGGIRPPAAYCAKPTTLTPPSRYAEE